MSNHVFEELLAIFAEANINLNQDQLAKLLHVSPGTIGNWKQGLPHKKKA